MTREEAAKLLPILQAFADGKTIQQTDGHNWYDLDEPDFMASASLYRIKPEPTYRPFANAEECWNEMLKHRWVKDKYKGNFICLTQISLDANFYFHYSNFTFADGSVFGVKIEE